MKHKSYLSCITAAVLLAGCAIPTSEGNPAVETAPAAEQSVSASIPQETVAPAYDDGKEYHASFVIASDAIISESAYNTILKYGAAKV